MKNGFEQITSLGDLTETPTENVKEESNGESAPENFELNLNRQVSRKDFLKGLGLFSAAMFITPKVTQLFSEKKQTTQEEIPTAEKITNDLIEIMNHRDQLGLGKTLPLKIRQAFEMTTEEREEMFPSSMEWNLEDRTFIRNNAPQINSYAQKTIKLIQKIAQNKAGRLVSDIKVYNRYPGYFPNKNPTLGLPENVESAYDQAKLLCHEVLGHGTDPDFKRHNLYPIEDLFIVEKAKWEALSRSWKIPDEFFNHPQDGSLKTLYETLGRKAWETEMPPGNYDNSAFIYKDPKNYDIFKREFLHAMGPLSAETKNEETIKIVGQVVLKMYMRKLIDIKPEIGVQTHLENALHEIYAEMMKYSILMPNEIEDPLIINNMEKILKVINPNLSIHQIRHIFRTECNFSTKTPTRFLPTPK
jgi:hypothetical protein